MGKLIVHGPAPHNMVVGFDTDGQPASANQAVVSDADADATYGTAERDLINNMKTLVNQLRNDLVELALIKGSA